MNVCERLLNHSDEEIFKVKSVSRISWFTLCKCLWFFMNNICFGRNFGMARSTMISHLVVNGEGMRRKWVLNLIFSISKVGNSLIITSRPPKLGPATQLRGLKIFVWSFSAVTWRKLAGKSKRAAIFWSLRWRARCRPLDRRWRAASERILSSKSKFWTNCLLFDAVERIVRDLVSRAFCSISRS